MIAEGNKGNKARAASPKKRTQQSPDPEKWCRSNGWNFSTDKLDEWDRRESGFKDSKDTPHFLKCARPNHDD